MTAIHLGCDPGLRGALAALDGAGDLVGTWPLPVLGGEVHAAGVADLLRSVMLEWPVRRLALEKVGAMPRQGVASTFRFGCGWGMVRGVCAALGLPVVLVTPPTWKRTVLHGLPHDKDGALCFCASRWPDADLVPPGCRKPHDGIADALCIAEWGRRQP